MHLGFGSVVHSSGCWGSCFMSSIGLGTSAFVTVFSFEGIELTLYGCGLGAGIRRHCRVRKQRDSEQVLLAAFLWRAAGKASAAGSEVWVYGFKTVSDFWVSGRQDGGRRRKLCSQTLHLYRHTQHITACIHAYIHRAFSALQSSRL